MTFFLKKYYNESMERVDCFDLCLTADKQYTFFIIPLTKVGVDNVLYRRYGIIRKSGCL